MQFWDLPTKADINGSAYEIRSDFRAVLDVLEVLQDAELTDAERGALAMRIFYVDFDEMKPADYEEAAHFLMQFVAGGELTAKQPKAKLADWVDDFPIYINPVNRVLGFEARSADYLHWWTFLGAYCEIGDCYFAQIVAIRKKKREGKKLEKWERDFYNANRDKIDIKTKLTSAEMALLRGLE